MVEGAPQLLIDIEQSGFAAFVRQSPWFYAAANVVHILGLAIFFAAIAIMDVRLLGGLAACVPGDIVFPARRVAIGALLVQIASGLVLFAAEASHVALNPVFQIKLVLIAIALANVALVTAAMRPSMREQAGFRLPSLVRVGAIASLVLWLAVAAAGRLIAYL